MGYIGSGPTRFNTADELTVTGDAELKGNTTIDGNLTVAGTTTSIDSASVQTVDLGDNDKIRLGDGNDLQIYWDGSTGQISSGFNVTGSVTTDGLTVSGNVSVDGGTIKLDGNYPVGTNNVAFGDTALDSISTGGYNTAIGHGALTDNVSADSNTAVGSAALTNTTGANNTGVGNSVMFNNTSGASNTAVGTNSLFSNTTANNNTAVGFFALNANTTGIQNTALGSGALDANTTASDNTAVGYAALGANETGTNNTAVGHVALDACISGNSNTAVGADALTALTTATVNVAVGQGAGQSNQTGISNTYIGRAAGNAATGEKNTFVGNDCGELVTSGSKNTIIGRYNGNQGGLDIRTSSNNIVLSDGDGNPRMHITYSGLASFYRPVATTNSDLFQLKSDVGGTRFTKFYVEADGDTFNSTGSYGTASDERIKENIVDATSQWDDIKALQVRKYSLIADQKEAPNQIGVIAQELETAGMTGLVTEREDGTKQVKYSILYMKAVKALQEAMDRIETLEAKVATLEGN